MAQSCTNEQQNPSRIPRLLAAKECQQLEQHVGLQLITVPTDLVGFRSGASGIRGFLWRKRSEGQFGDDRYPDCVLDQVDSSDKGWVE